MTKTQQLLEKIHGDRSLRTKIRARFLAERRLTPDGCWLWGTSTQPGGYSTMSIENINLRTNRLSYCVFSDLPLQNELVCHKCNVPLCIKPKHLYAGTHSDNMKDAVRAGAHYFSRFRNRRLGEQNPAAKLTPKKVRAIRKEYRQGLSGNVLAKKYDVNRATIYFILNGVTWRHVA